MLFFNFHIGDWMTGTRLMSATEKGLYMDLLTFYYSVERPITKDECRRIEQTNASAYSFAMQMDVHMDNQVQSKCNANGYANVVHEAMQYILDNHFVEENGVYRHKRCDAVISENARVIEKRKKASKSRWDKAKGEKTEKEKQSKCKANAKQMDMHVDMHMDNQVQCKCNANGMLTDNHKPLTNINNHNKQLTEIFNEGREHEETELVDDSIAIHAEVPEPVLDSNYDVGLYEETAIDQLERHVEDGLDKVIDDFNHVVTPMEVIALARLYGLKVPRDQRLNDACARKILTIDHVRKCIEICKNKAKSGYYLVGILRNAVNDPEQYHTVSYHLSSKKYELAPEDDTVF